MTWLEEYTCLLARFCQHGSRCFCFCQFIAHTILHPALFHAAPNNRRAISRGDGVLHFLCTWWMSYVATSLRKKNKRFWIDQKIKYSHKSYPLKITADVVATTPPSINQSIFLPGLSYLFCTIINIWEPFWITADPAAGFSKNDGDM